MDSVFVSTKSALALVLTLMHLEPSAQVFLTVDASDFQVGSGFLPQLVQGSWAPLAFYSKKLSSTEFCYSTFDCELIAAYVAWKHFCFLLEGRSFTLFTDHKPLTFALFTVIPPWSARQQCHLSYLFEFTSDLVHLPGSQNVVADTLSCPSPFPSPPLFPILQLSCAETSALLCNPSDQFVSVPSGGSSVLCNLFTGLPRPVVPVSLHRRIFYPLHSISHPGVCHTRRLVLRAFVWSGFPKDV